MVTKVGETIKYCDFDKLFQQTQSSFTIKQVVYVKKRPYFGTGSDTGTITTDYWNIYRILLLNADLSLSDRCVIVHS